MTRERISILEDVERTWDPEKFAKDDHLNFVLEVLMMGPIRQSDLAELVSMEFGITMGGARAICSAALLMFRREGWAESNSRVENSNVWNIVE
jgi:hypothetical protein